MARKSPGHSELLEISRSCANEFVRAGGSSPTVAELASAAGVAERTFYRYFLTKHDSLRPILVEGNREFAAAIQAQDPARGLVSGLTQAFAQTFPAAADDESRALMATVFDDPGLRRVWLEVSYETGQLIRPGIAALVGADEASIRTTVACGQAVLLVIAGLTHMVRDGLSSAEAADAAVAAMFGAPLGN